MDSKGLSPANDAREGRKPRGARPFWISKKPEKKRNVPVAETKENVFAKNVVELSVPEKWADPLGEESFLVHPPGSVLFDAKLQVVFGSNGVGKSTFLREISEANGIPMYSSADSEPRARLGGSLENSKDLRRDIRSIMSSSGQSQFRELVGFLDDYPLPENKRVILDEPERGLSVSGQIGLCHLIVDEMRGGRSFVIVTHSYVLLKFAEKNGFAAYDFDSKKFMEKFVPEL